jgi:signal transduction histidine kinase/streptogramin lyase
LLLDSHKILWAGTSNNGLIVIDTKTDKYQLLDAEHYSFNQLKSNSIREIIECNAGIIWITTKFGGLHYFDRRQQTFPIITKESNERPGLSDEFVLCAIEDNNKDLWIGTKTGGLNRLNRSTNTYTHFKASKKHGDLKSDRIEAIVKDENGTLWIGTQAGLKSMHPDTLHFRHHTNFHARNLAYTSTNDVWIGTANGIFRFSCSKSKLSPLSTQHTNFFDVENNISVTKIFEDSHGILWIGTGSNGLFEYHSKNDSLFNHLHNPANKQTLSGNLIRGIFEDANQNLWIGTKSDGLNFYDRKTNKFYPIKDIQNMPFTSIYSILEDHHGHLWMGTHNGIVEYNPKTGVSNNYTVSHGIQSPIFEINSFCKTSDNHLLFGGNKGINIFNPDEVSFEAKKSPVIISNFYLLHKTIAKDIASFQSFELNRNNNHLSFEFALLDYTNPDENRYAYKLTPFDEDWIDAGNRNFATYTNLPPGKYQFKVIGKNSLNFQNDNQTIEVEIIIPAPYYKMWWFITLIALFSVAILLSVYFLRLIAIKKRELMLKQIVKQRTKELSDAFQKLEDYNKQIAKHNQDLRIQRDQISRQNLELEIHRQNLELMVADRTKDLEEAKEKAEDSDRLKSAFLANMSHEIRTPLNAIVGFVELIEAGQIEGDERITAHEIIQANSHALLQLINDIIDISMIEANQLVICNKEFNFNDFLKEIKFHYNSNPDLKEKNNNLDLLIPNPAESLIIQSAPDRVRQIFINLINNSIKFTEHGTITFGYTFDLKEKSIVCFVKDTGSGISLDNQKKLFERFMKIEPNQSKVYRGTGLGLSISKNLCELLGGKIWVESEIGKGTHFYFTLPFEF